MNTIEEINKADKAKLYYDAGKFKGNTLEQNINAINKLYLGLGIKISDIPYIYINEKENNIYLSSTSFAIESNGKNIEINYPISFIYQVFYYNNFLFYLEEHNELRVFEFDPKNFSIKSYSIPKKIIVGKNKKTNS